MVFERSDVLIFCKRRRTPYFARWRLFALKRYKLSSAIKKRLKTQILAAVFLVINNLLLPASERPPDAMLAALLSFRFRYS